MREYQLQADWKRGEHCAACRQAKISE